MFGFNPLYVACIQAVGGGLQPTFSADFTTGTLRGDLTFSRASNATMFDSTGRMVWAPSNLAGYSESLGSAGWTASGTPTVSTVADAPSGFSNSFEITTTATNHGYFGAAGINRNITTGVPYIFSAWVKSVSGTAAIIFSAGSSTVTVPTSTSWTRVSGRVVPTNNAASIGAGLGGGTMRVAGFQVEPEGADSPKAYNPTTTVAYYGPRFDYDPVSLQPRGLLIEESRSNLITYSRDFAQAAWAKTDITVSAGSTVWGDAYGGLITEGSATTALMHTGFVITANTALSGSFVVKSGGAVPVTWVRILLADTTGANGAKFWFNVAAGTVGGTTIVGTGSAASSTIVDLGNGYYRVCVTCVVDAASTVGRLYINSAIGNSSDARLANATYYFDNAQAEHGLGSTSVIPTYGASATRAADSCFCVPGSWFTNALGTIVTFTGGSQPGEATRVVWSITDGTTANRLQVFRSTASQAQATSTVATVSDFSPVAAGTIAAQASFKTACAWSAAGKRLSRDGGAVVTSAVSPPLTGSNRFDIGTLTGTQNVFNGWIKSIKYFNSVLTDSQLQAMTT